MDHQHNTIRLYSAQDTPVIAAIHQDGLCFSKAAYVRKKYAESAPIFLTAYSWFVAKAERIVPKPEGAEFPYWAFQNLYHADSPVSGKVLTLDVPKDQAVFFDLYDWKKIMQLRYLGESTAEEEDFHRQLAQRGLNENKVMLTDFYPEWKKQIFYSWNRLFRHHEQIQSDGFSELKSVQAGLWCIKEAWIQNRIG